MGRKTHESIGRALPGRRMAELGLPASGKTERSFAQVVLCGLRGACMELATPASRYWVIGLSHRKACELLSYYWCPTGTKSKQNHRNDMPGS